MAEYNNILAISGIIDIIKQNQRIKTELQQNCQALVEDIQKIKLNLNPVVVAATLPPSSFSFGKVTYEDPSSVIMEY